MVRGRACDGGRGGHPHQRFGTATLHGGTPSWAWGGSGSQGVGRGSSCGFGSDAGEVAVVELGVLAAHQGGGHVLVTQTSRNA
eukprot:1159002-Pelagomonas_calceolata.AAC.5